MPVDIVCHAADGGGVSSCQNNLCPDGILRSEQILIWRTSCRIYSMAPLIIKGFLPQQNGSAIMLPADITTIAGSDFDVKLY